jgi:hypothetical protein
VTDIDTVTVKDRQVPIRKINETQMMVMVREARVLSSNRQETERRLRSMAIMIDIIESCLVDPEDQEWLMGLAGTGQIGFAEILAIVAPYMDEEEQVAKKPVRRGRTAARK